MLRADPDVPVADLLGSAAVRANPFLAKMSAGDLQDWANRKMAASGSNAPVPQTSGTAVPMAAAAGAPAAPLPLSPAGGGSSDGALPPDLLAQLQAIPRLAQAQPDISDQAPPPLMLLPHPAAMARARILSRVMAGQPIAEDLPDVPKISQCFSDHGRASDYRPGASCILAMVAHYLIERHG